MDGWHGRYLRIVPRPGRTACIASGDLVYRDFLGGVGLRTWIVAHEMPAGTDPLVPEAALAYAFSPLVGSPLMTSAKFAVVALSPLTGRVCDALASSHFAIAAKRAGINALAITGACETPSVAFVDGMSTDEPRVEWRSAGLLRGLPAREAEDRLRAENGTDWQVAAIGPAGERLIPFATLSHDGRHAGRGGLCAVLGAKKSKAVAVRGDRRTTLADPAATVALARRLSALSFGSPTEEYRELGTVANLLTFNRFNNLPNRNFRSGHFEGAGRLATEDLGPARRIAKASCAACTIGCEHITSVGREPKGVRLEYESLFALGPFCGIDDPETILLAARACDDAGLDTISTGGTIAFLMDFAERGWIDGRVGPSARVLRFGDGAAVLDAISALVDRRDGLGELLALGSRRAAERIGGEALDFAPHVKGLEPPGYDPRGLHAMALGLAVGTRGADHNRSGAYEADFSDHVDRRHGDDRSALAAIETEDRAAVKDSMILCEFLRGVFSDFFAESAEMLAAVTGCDFTSEELRVVARRVVNARKCLNQSEGCTALEDTLPPRLLSDSPPSPDSPSLSRERLDARIATYYQARGWTEDGCVHIGLRRALGLDDPAFGPESSAAPRPSIVLASTRTGPPSEAAGILGRRKAPDQ